MTMTEVELPFDPPLPSADGLSVAQRRRRRHVEALAAGRHPLAGGPTRETPGEGCRECRFHEVVVNDGSETIHHVCALAAGDSLAAIEIRLRWPGCTRWISREAVGR